MADEFALVAPFLTDAQQFTLDVEFGQWYERIKPKKDGRIAGRVRMLIHRENQDRILLLASRLGYAVKRQRMIDETWMSIDLEGDRS